MSLMDPALLALLDEQDKRRARVSFLAFYMRMTGFLPPKHIKVLAKELQDLEEDRFDRLMVFMPPRHSKTTLCSILFAAWIMGRYPSSKLMSVVHTQRYAGKVGRAVRNLMRSPMWPFDDVRLADDMQAREQWGTPQGGEYNGFGAIGGNQHGNAAEWLFMDDLIKGRAMAMSAHMREEIWETYKADLLSRLEGRHKQIMTYTRWNMDDPAGRILAEGFDGQSGWYPDRETGEMWRVISMPAVSEHENDPMGRQIGEWLWPERFGEEQLGGMRRRGGWMWSSLYQQRPSPTEGMLFTQDHLSNRYDPSRIHIPGLQIYISSDYAVTEESVGADPDWTVHLVWGVDEDWNIYLLDGWRGRTLSDEWVRHWIRLVKRWKPLRSFEEAGQILKSVGPLITQMQRQENAYTSRVQIQSDSKKWMRAQTLVGMASLGKLYLPERAKCTPRMLVLLDAFETELMQFPSGRHDDTVDAATLFARGLDRMIAGTDTRKAVSPHDHTLDDLWSRNESRRDT